MPLVFPFWSEIGKYGFARKQSQAAPFLAESAHASLLAGVREAFREPACHDARPAYDREARRRCGRCGSAHPGRQGLTGSGSTGIPLIMRDKIKLISSAGTGHYYT